MYNLRPIRTRQLYSMYGQHSTAIGRKPHPGNCNKSKVVFLVHMRAGNQGGGCTQLTFSNQGLN